MFYVISGFLITYILSGKYSADARGRWIFYTNRALKIFVPYLAVLAGTIILSLVAYVVTGNAVALSAFFAEAHNMSASTWAYAIFSEDVPIGVELRRADVAGMNVTRPS